MLKLALCPAQRIKSLGPLAVVGTARLKLAVVEVIEPQALETTTS